MSTANTAPSTFWHRLWLDARALALPVGAFWGATILGLLLFTAVVATVSTNDENSVPIVGGMWLATIGGTALGQLVAIARVRTPWVVVGATAAWFAGVFAFVGTIAAVPTLAGLDPLMIVAVICAFLGPLFFACGHFSLSTHLGMLATFSPIMWFAGSILVVANHTDAAATWQAGDKWAIWSVLTTPMLAAGVILILIYLATRELHRLHLWRYSERGPDVAWSRTTGFFGLLAMPGCGSVIALLLLGTALTVGAAAIAPYLWRTSTGEEPDGTSAPGEPREPGEPQPRGPGQQASQALQQAIRALVTLLMAVLFALAAILVFGPPLRRMVLLQYLRAPFWPVAPSRRVAQHWRLVEIALGDAGVHRQPGDSAQALALRGVKEADLLDPASLVRASEVADRVAYGLGVQPDDVMVARRAAEMTYQSVWDDLGEFAKWKAMYRIL